MNYTLEDATLTLSFKGDINSITSETVAADIEKTIAGLTFEHLIFDFHDVVYVSSAGLRIVLRYKQRYGDLSIINASMDVYDVFQMTGFTSIMSVSRALTKIDVDPSQIIGEGYCSTVYRIDKDTIIKVFKNATNIADVEREMALAREAFILGIPTAITFDVVQVGDKYGARFEMLDSISLRDAFRDLPDQFENLCKDYANLLKTINTTVPSSPNLPSAKQLFLNKLKLILPHLGKEEGEKLSKMAEAIPDARTFVHGDCHVKNILCQNKEVFLIDMDTLSVGDPIFELAGIYATYIAFEEASPGNNEVFLGLPKELTDRLYRRVLELYFGKWDEAAWKKIKTVSYAHMVWWGETYDPNDRHRIDFCAERLKECLKDVEELALTC